ncbi:cytochrome P450 [Clohesyomyces aquaticus]|uniref:Cytochrome P450 n=1 Tax=Clohesyomyces aquaticus TaxID=1231657 RepID=A0A1Y1YUE8_9PLEO|nr:cytochrome P450 [Clohesyomyces aquaticus]
MTSISRIRKANIPWFFHIAVIPLSVYLFPRHELRVFLLIYAFITFLFDTEEVLKALQDPNEPPLIPHHGLPFLGHVLGMFWYGASYFARVNSITQHPIFTLQTWTARTIVVISPQLAAPIQRASKNTSFYRMILEVTKRLVDFDDPSMKIITYNLDNELGHGSGLMIESHAMLDSMLSPGPDLNKLSATQLDQFSALLNDFISPPSPSKTVNLMTWVKQTFTTANAFTVYGPLNPFALHPSLVSSFWRYEAGMAAVMADIFPYLTARKPWLARRAVNAALHEFVEKEHYKSASQLIQNRVSMNLRHGFTAKMAGRAELILLFGILGNAVPTTFWFLSNIFARPELLARIREETRQAITTSTSPSPSGTEKFLSVATLKSSCPLLVSTYRETLRSIANLASVRLVTKTHTINTPPNTSYPPYLLKAGSMIQIASGVIHSAPSVWGPDATSFMPTRFISSSTTAAYRAFGGGSVICPGRHFAQSEILGFVALCVHMFEIEGLDRGVMELPVRDDERLPFSVMKPVREPIVRMRRRSGEEGWVWRLKPGVD